MRGLAAVPMAALITRSVPFMGDAVNPCQAYLTAGIRALSADQAYHWG
jgi:hypothetical protein